MLQVEYHPSVVEQAVFLATRRDRTIERTFRSELDAVYEISDPLSRETEFGRVHECWFAKLHLDRDISELIRERPLIEAKVQRCHVREAPSRRRQNVELLVRQASTEQPDIQRALFIDVCADSLLDAGRLRSWLQRELLKVSDMLDEAFCYSPDLPEAHRARQNLVRDRYGVLWDIYVEARLKPGAGSADPHPRLCERFERTFSCGGAAASTQCVAALQRLTTTTHNSLLRWALAPETMPGWQPDPANARRSSGEVCPLCQFPTFDWYSFCNDRDGYIRTVISSIQPLWRPEQGVCRQCAETCATVGLAGQNRRRTWSSRNESAG